MSRLIDRIRWAYLMTRLASDPATVANLLRLRFSRRRGGTLAVRLRPLRGHPVSVRTGTDDLWAVLGMTPPLHLPPASLARDEIATIWDLGANIGLTMCHLAIECPRARIVGVELDPENAALCRHNIEPWVARCALVEAAVWDVDGEVVYGREEGNEHAFRVDPDAADGRTARAISLNSLLERYSPETAIDYVKVDIEGAEQRVLQLNTAWAERVRAIKVEVHPPYVVEDCIRDLRSLGFEAELDPLYTDWSGMPAVMGAKEP